MTQNGPETRNSCKSGPLIRKRKKERKKATERVGMKGKWEVTTRSVYDTYI